jgi:hypothetical protein
MFEGAGRFGVADGLTLLAEEGRGRRPLTPDHAAHIGQRQRVREEL